MQKSREEWKWREEEKRRQVVEYRGESYSDVGAERNKNELRPGGGAGQSGVCVGEGERAS